MKFSLKESRYAATALLGAGLFGAGLALSPMSQAEPLEPRERDRIGYELTFDGERDELDFARWTRAYFGGHIDRDRLERELGREVFRAFRQGRITDDDQFERELSIKFERELDRVLRDGRNYEEGDLLERELGKFGRQLLSRAVQEGRFERAYREGHIGPGHFERMQRWAAEWEEREEREAIERMERDRVEREEREAAEREKREAAEREKREAVEREEREAIERMERDRVEREKHEAAEREAAEAAERAEREELEGLGAMPAEAESEAEAAEREAEAAAEREAEATAEREVREAAEREAEATAAAEREAEATAAAEREAEATAEREAEATAEREAADAAEREAEAEAQREAEDTAPEPEAAEPEPEAAESGGSPSDPHVGGMYSVISWSVR